MENYEYSSDGVKCPYCQHKRKTDVETDYTEDGFEEECEECDKKFYVSGNQFWSWTSTKDCTLNGKKNHDWKDTSKDNEYIGKVSKTPPYHTYCECRRCGETKYVDLKEFKRE